MRTVLATTGFVLIAAFFLATEHRAHLFGLLPFLFLLACPLLHMFGHSGHGAHGGRGNHTAHADPARGAVGRPPSREGEAHAGHSPEPETMP